MGVMIASTTYNP